MASSEMSAVSESQLELDRDPHHSSRVSSSPNDDGYGHDDGQQALTKEEDRSRHYLTAHLVSARGVSVLVMPPEYTTSTTPGNGDGEFQHLLDPVVLKRKLEQACFKATGIHLDIDVFEGRPHVLVDESTIAHTGVCGEELAQSLRCHSGRPAATTVVTVAGADEEPRQRRKDGTNPLATAAVGSPISRTTDQPPTVKAESLTPEQVGALEERSPLVLMPQAIATSISQARILDSPWFYRPLNSRVGIACCILLELLAGVPLMLPYHMKEQRWVDLTTAIGLAGYCVPHLLLFLTFYRNKCAMILRSFEFWYMLGHSTVLAIFVGIKYTSAGANPYLVWPFICVGLCAFTASLMMDASPFPLLLRTFFNFFMCALWLFWTVAMAESEIFYNDGVNDDFGERRGFGVFDSNFRVLYCSSSLTVALFFGRYVVSGLLGNEYVLLKANLVRHPTPLQYMKNGITLAATDDEEAKQTGSHEEPDFALGGLGIAVTAPMAAGAVLGTDNGRATVLGTTAGTASSGAAAVNLADGASPFFAV